VEAERLRAEAEKQRGDDLSKIAMMLAAGKGKGKDSGEVIPQSPPAAADKSTSNATTSKSPSKQDDRGRVKQGCSVRCTLCTLYAVRCTLYVGGGYLYVPHVRSCTFTARNGLPVLLRGCCCISCLYGLTHVPKC
jgi:hypothetical protein